MRKLKSASTVESKIIRNGKRVMRAIRLLPSDNPETKYIYIEDSVLKQELDNLISKSKRQKPTKVVIEGRYNRMIAFLTIEFNPGQDDKFKFCFYLQKRQVVSDSHYINRLRGLDLPEEQGIGNTA